MLVSDSRREPPEIRTQIDTEIAEIADSGRIRVLGPDSMGFVNTAAAVNITYATTTPRPGRLAFVSQSGSFYNATLDMAFKEQIGFSYFISVGAMVDVDFGDVVDYLGNDENVSSILLCMHNLKSPRKFLSAARSVSPLKPIVVFKTGQHQHGVCLTADHIETPAFEEAVYHAVFKRAGIVSVDSIDEMFDCAELMSKQPRPTGDRLVVISNGGALGPNANDMMLRCNMEPRPLKPETVEALDKKLPAYWSRSNPINLLSGAGADNYAHAVSTCLKDLSINGLLITMVPEAGTSSVEVARSLVDVVKNARIPILAAWCGGRDMVEGIEIFNAAGIPTFRTPKNAITAFSHLIEYNRNQKIAHEIPAKLDRQLAFDHDRAKELMAVQNGEVLFLTGEKAGEVLKAYGIPFVITKTAENESQALTVAKSIGYPVAMKISLASAPQMYDSGSAETDLRTPAELQAAFKKLVTSHETEESSAPSRIARVQIQSYISRPDYKLYLGIKRDKNFGPVLLFGIGGIYSLLIGERNLGLPPLNRLLARQLMENTRAFELLNGYRDRLGANLEQLEELLIRLSQLAIDFPQIERLDIHPVIIKDGKAAALDALVRLKHTQVSSPRHLVISPYPANQEQRVLTKNGLPLYIRPVRPEDAPLFMSFIETLSDTSIYYRFFRHISKFTPQQIYRFTNIDYDRQIALIALKGEGETIKMLGVIRIIRHPDGEKGDLYLGISDAFQKQGIGSTLLHAALDIAFKQGYESICGMVLPENEGMKQLARKTGFQVKFNFEDKVFDLTLDRESFAAASTSKG